MRRGAVNGGGHLARAAHAVSSLARKAWGNTVVRVVVSLTALAAGAWLVHLQLKGVTTATLLAAVGRTHRLALVLSVLCTALSYGCLAVVEWKLLKLIGKPLPFRRMVLPSLASNALSIVMGFGLFSGSAVRLRTYAFAKFETADIARLVLWMSLGTWISGAVASGLTLIPRAMSHIGSPGGWALAAAATALVAPAALWFLAFRRNGEGSGAELTTQDRAVALAAALGDWLFSGAALFVLESHKLTALPAFLSVFCLGSLAGSLAGVPGGLGVLEAVMLALHAETPVHETAAALVLYRAIYFLAPLLLTLVGIAGAWLLDKTKAVKT